MKKILFALLALISVSSFAITNKVIKLYKNGEVIKQYTLDEVDYIEVENYIEDHGVIDGHDYVDLGLPSGLKWATCNIGASTPEKYGNYYAWGETATKYSYTEKNSVMYNISNSDLQAAGVIDIDIDENLTAAYDAATVNWGSAWRIPTLSEIAELMDKCTWIWTTHNGVNGYKVIGPNGNYIFLPASGLRDGTDLEFTGNNASYWCSTPSYDRRGALYMWFGKDDYDSSATWRYLGLTVRPVSK